MDIYMGLLTVGVFVLLFYALRKTAEVLVAVKKPRAPAQNQIGVNLPLSLTDFVMGSDQGLDYQLGEIEKRCEKEGVNVKNDIGYKTLKSQSEMVKLGKMIVSNPITGIPAEIVYQIARDNLPTISMAVKRFFRNV